MQTDITHSDEVETQLADHVAKLRWKLTTTCGLPKEALTLLKPEIDGLSKSQRFQRRCGTGWR